jgi:hypothetical protein
MGDDPVDSVIRVCEGEDTAWWDERQLRGHFWAKLITKRIGVNTSLVDGFHLLGTGSQLAASKSQGECQQIVRGNTIVLTPLSPACYLSRRLDQPVVDYLILAAMCRKGGDLLVRQLSSVAEAEVWRRDLHGNGQHGKHVVGDCVGD